MAHKRDNKETTKDIAATDKGDELDEGVLRDDVTTSMQPEVGADSRLVSLLK